MVHFSEAENYPDLKAYSDWNVWFLMRIPPFSVWTCWMIQDVLHQNQVERQCKWEDELISWYPLSKCTCVCASNKTHSEELCMVHLITIGSHCSFLNLSISKSAVRYTESRVHVFSTSRISLKVNKDNEDFPFSVCRYTFSFDIFHPVSFSILQYFCRSSLHKSQDVKVNQIKSIFQNPIITFACV